MTLSASSSTKMSEPMKMFASFTSALNCSKFSGSRSSSRMYPEHSTATSGWPALIRLHAAVSDDWYCDSSTTYTTLNIVRSPGSSGTTLRSAGFDAVNMPAPPCITGAAERDARCSIGSTASAASAERRTLEAAVAARWPTAASEGVKGEPRCRCRHPVRAQLRGERAGRARAV